MKKFVYILFLILFTFKAYSHSTHYKGLVKIEMDVLRNGDKIGYTNYYFEHGDNTMTVKNYTNFKVELFGATIFSISSESEERYEDDKLIFYKSNTFQNDKEKFVNLNYDKSLKKFIIDGSSFKGTADMDCIVGNWWNNKILKANKQISPLSGSIKEQMVSFIGKENIIINNKNYLADHFKLKSKNDNLPKEKKLDFENWYDPKNNLILKVSYSKMGDWIYILKNFE